MKKVIPLTLTSTPFTSLLLNLFFILFNLGFKVMRKLDVDRTTLFEEVDSLKSREKLDDWKRNIKSRFMKRDLEQQQVLVLTYIQSLTLSLPLIPSLTLTLTLTLTLSLTLSLTLTLTLTLTHS
jgi:hypothetical protein